MTRSWWYPSLVSWDPVITGRILTGIRDYIAGRERIIHNKYNKYYVSVSGQAARNICYIDILVERNQGEEPGE